VPRRELKLLGDDRGFRRLLLDPGGCGPPRHRHPRGSAPGEMVRTRARASVLRAGVLHRGRNRRLPEPGGGHALSRPHRQSDRGVRSGCGVRFRPGGLLVHGAAALRRHPQARRLATAEASPWVLPAVYGMGTALPVLALAALLAFGARWVGRAFRKAEVVERIVRRMTGVLFVGAGLYLCWVYVLRPALLG
jgi:hypothetical protein